MSTQVKIPYKLKPLNKDSMFHRQEMFEQGNTKFRTVARVYKQLESMELKSDDYLVVLQDDHIVVDFENAANAIMFKLALVM